VAIAAARSSIDVPEAFSEDLRQCNPAEDDCGRERVCAESDTFKDSDDDGPFQDFVCLHKQLDDPFSWRDGVAMVLVVLVSGVGGVAGIGGFSVSLRLLEGLNNFLEREAAVLSNTAALGALSAQFVLNAPRRFGDEVEYPLIDVELLLAVVPAAVSGILVGEILRRFMPEIIVMIITLIALVLLAAKVVQRTRHIRRQEREAATVKRAYQSSLLDEFGSNHSALTISDRSSTSDLDLMQNSMKPQAELKIPFGSICLLAAFWLLCLIQAIFVEEGFVAAPTCSLTHWVSLLCIIPVAVIVSILALCIREGNLLRKDQKVGRGDPTSFTRLSTSSAASFAANFESEGSVTITESLNRELMTLWMPCIAASVGFFTGLLKVELGDLLAPVLVLLQMDCLRLSSLTGAASLFVASLDFLQFVVRGNMAWAYHGVLFGCGFLGSAMGRKFAIFAASTLRRTAVIAVALSILTLSALALTVLRLVDEDPEWSIGDICED